MAPHAHTHDPQGLPRHRHHDVAGTPRGRRRITHHLIPQCLDRSGGKAGRELPIVTLVGPRGSGKTKVLKDIEDGCVTSVALPYAWLDLDSSGYERGWQVAAHLAAGLGGTRWKQFGEIGFPRLALGALVIQARGIDLSNPGNAAAGIQTLLQSRRDLEGLTNAIAELLRQLLNSIVPPLAVLVGPLVSGTFKSRKVVEMLFRDGMHWYGNRGRGPAGDGFGALVDLHRLEREGGDSGRREVDVILCEAFLADLAHAYAGKNRPCNTVALIDNIDSRAGRAFLRAMAGARTNAGATGGRCDPLAVISTSRVWWQDALWPWGPPWERRADVEFPVGTTGDADFDDWTARRPAGDPGRWYYPVELGDLTEDEVRALAAATRPRELTRLAPFVYRLTRGHALGAVRVLDTLSARQRTPTDPELIDVLESPTGESSKLGDDLTTDLLKDLGSWREELETLSAIPDPRSAVADTIAGLLETESAERCDDLARRLWLDPPKSAGAAAHTHPWLRRLLLRSLAARGEPAHLTWDAVHSGLAQHFEGSSEVDRACYHALAGGDVRPAVEYLRRQFVTRDMADWIRLFDAITAAPNRPSGPADRRRTELLSTFAAPSYATLDISQVLVRMIIARWIGADPLCDPDSAMSFYVAVGFDALSVHATLGADRLVHEAQRYR